jgi:predicted MFS family arabinose efflux permease
MLYLALSLPLQASFDEDDVGIVMGMFVFARQMGVVAGVALGAVVFNNAFARDIKKLGALPAELLPLESGKAAVDLFHGSMKR